MATLDYIVIGGYLAVMLGIGGYYSRRARSTEEYMLGGRTMSAWKVGVSLFAGTFSTISYLMIPGEVIQHGPGVMWILAAVPIEAAIICLWIIPRFMRTRIVSAYELLETRLGISGRIVAATVFLAPRLAWMGLILFVVSTKVLVPALGYPDWAAPLVAIALGMITVTYAAMGGLRAIVISDVVQAFILFGGIAVTLAIVTTRMGGFGWIPSHWSPHWDHQPVFSLDPYVRLTVVGVVIYNVTAQVLVAGGDQITIQRYLATPNVGQARRMYCMNALALVLAAALLPLVGLALMGYFMANPDLLPHGLTLAANGDKVFPFFIIHILPAGMTGLLISALLAAAMGAMASGVNSTCSVVMTDFLDRFRREKTTDRKRVRESKRVAFAIGTAAVLLSLAMGRIPGNILEVCAKSSGLFAGPLFIFFFMALLVPWADAFGAIWAASLSLLVAVAIAYWDVFTHHPGLSFTLILPVSTAAGLVFGPLMSALHRKGRLGLLGCNLVGALPVLALIGVVISHRI